MAKSPLRGSVISDPMANKCDLPGKEDVTFATFTPSSKGAFDYAHAKSGTGRRHRRSDSRAPPAAPTPSYTRRSRSDRRRRRRPRRSAAEAAAAAAEAAPPPPAWNSLQEWVDRLAPDSDELDGALELVRNESAELSLMMLNGEEPDAPRSAEGYV